MEHLEHKKEKRNERAAIQLGLFLVGLLLFGTAAGGQLTGEEKNGKEKADFWRRIRCSRAQKDRPYL